MGIEVLLRFVVDVSLELGDFVLRFDDYREAVCAYNLKLFSFVIVLVEQANSDKMGKNWGVVMRNGRVCVFGGDATSSVLRW